MDAMPTRGWRRSSFSPEATCVELAHCGGAVALRNSNAPGGGTLVVSRPQLAGLVAGIRAGEYHDLI